ncbi:hypothetical protein ES332_A12G184800v1 [Gossypium tomentosum]|uniref:Uncharacterized protein n=1 Tax=Gossypium tomentosum TaxID=34277 RepID=A0A5D2MYC2_GOSTO|nr:hypothetical protein ES332_A12G184800v1 [Gossypium tomentosum]
MQFSYPYGQNSFDQNQHGQNWVPAGARGPVYGFHGGSATPNANRHGGVFNGPNMPNLNRVNNAFGLGNFNGVGPMSNCVQVGYPLDRDRTVGPINGEGCDASTPPVPWRTKP